MTRAQQEVARKNEFIGKLNAVSPSANTYFTAGTSTGENIAREKVDATDPSVIPDDVKEDKRAETRKTGKTVLIVVIVVVALWAIGKYFKI